MMALKNIFKMPPRQANLNVQEGDEEQRGFLSGDLENNHEPTRDAVKRDRPTDHRYSTLLPLAIFFLSIVFLVSGVWYKQPDRRCVQKMNAWCMSLCLTRNSHTLIFSLKLQ